MIQISFKDGQGLGNQLWLFAVAKSISEKLKIDLNIKDFEKFKGKNFLNLDYENNTNHLLRSSKKLSMDDFKIFNERVYYDHELKYVISSFDERVLSINKNTILEGIFQSEKYFFGNLDKLKRYIQLKSSIKKTTNIDPYACILNIRGGEYKRHKNFILKKQYWENAMANFENKWNINNFLIVTDDYNYARSLFPKLEVISGDISRCYAALYKCKNIIVSNSSFSYFPCKTGYKKNVIAPMYWARPSKNKGRWISPGNIYKDWYWQNKENNLMSYEKCLEIANKTEQFYKNEFTVLVNKNQIPKMGILNFVPRKYKIILKKILSYFFPQSFG